MRSSSRRARRRGCGRARARHARRRRRLRKSSSVRARLRDELVPDGLVLLVPRRVVRSKIQHISTSPYDETCTHICTDCASAPAVIFGNSMEPASRDRSGGPGCSSGDEYSSPRPRIRGLVAARRGECLPRHRSQRRRSARRRRRRRQRRGSSSPRTAATTKMQQNR